MRNSYTYLGVIIFGFLIVPGLVSALELRVPESGATNVDTDEFFEWEKVENAVRYVLDIEPFSLSEDNISSTSRACSNNPDTCKFEFLSLQSGRITNTSSYTWKVTAYDGDENLLESSVRRTFTTKQDDAVVITPQPGPTLCNSEGEVCTTGDLSQCSEENCSTDPNDPPPNPGPVTDPPPSGILRIDNPISAETPGEFAEAIINFLFGLSIVVAPIVVIYAGFLMVTAGGDPSKFTRARDILVYAAIGIGAILIARGIPNILQTLL